ncbi:MAG TPA: DUF4382 domain-containing protein [Dehalococcoidia bacterium]|nr:DUF4382 domain-containing protein [Dehalococcoidia bacterium]
MSTGEFDRVLDECLDRMMAGETLDSCLDRYPQWADELQPLLRVYATTEKTAAGVPSAAAITAARMRMQQARAAHATRTRRSLPLTQRIFSRPLAFAATGSVAVIVLAMVLLLPVTGGAPTIPTSPDGTTPTAPSADETPTVPSESGTPADEEGVATSSADTVPATPQAEGNFVLLLSDAPNDISDFESLIISISTVHLKPEGGGPWVELTPQVQSVDLTRLQGDLAVEIWRGDVPEGDYAGVHVHVSSAEGRLAATGAAVEVSLPSGRLQVDSTFTVRCSGAATHFVFDITVHRNSTVQKAARYIISPQASESGAGIHYTAVEPHGASVGASGPEARDRGSPPNDTPGPPGADRPGKEPKAPQSGISPGRADIP